MAARRRRSSSPPQSQTWLDVQGFSCGVVVALLAALPGMFNPRGLNAFGVVKASMLQPLDLLAGIAAACAAWGNRRRFFPATLPLAAVAVVAVFSAATLFGVAPALLSFAPDVRHEGTLVLLTLKLDKAVTLDAVDHARIVSDTILLATGVDVQSSAGRARAAADLERAGFRALAAVYANDLASRR